MIINALDINKEAAVGPGNNLGACFNGDNIFAVDLEKPAFVQHAFQLFKGIINDVVPVVAGVQIGGFFKTVKGPLSAALSINSLSG